MPALRHLVEQFGKYAVEMFGRLAAGDRIGKATFLATARLISFLLTFSHR